MNSMPQLQEQPQRTSMRTPLKVGQNADYYPDLRREVLTHIQRNIFATGAITLEPAFYENFLNKAPQLDLAEIEELEGCLRFTFPDLASQISSAVVEKDM
jgi:hypothetical protein